MDRGSESLAAHGSLGLVKALLGTYPVCSPRLAMMGWGRGRHLGTHHGRVWSSPSEVSTIAFTAGQ